MPLSKRLLKIAEIVKFPTLCDIGTDHARLPVYLVKSRVITRAAACDVNSGPLSRARENIRQAGLERVIETRLGNGLAPINPGEFECCVIAGLGGRLIAEIISNGLETALKFGQLILSPHRDAEFLRRFLHENGFAITGEEIIRDAGKWYFIMDCRAGTEDPYCDAGYMFGQRLIERKNAELIEFLSSESEKYAKPGAPEKLRVYGEKCREVLEWLSR